MRATEQSGVSLRGSGVGWVVVFVVITALAVQMSVLVASASADELGLVVGHQDEALAAPVAADDVTTSESRSAAPAPEPALTSREPVEPSGPPTGVESPEPDAVDSALPPPSELDSPDVTHAADPTGPAESSSVSTRQSESINPAVTETVTPMPAATAPSLSPVLPPVAPESAARPPGLAPKRSRAGNRVGTVAWGRPGSIVSGVTVAAWGAVVKGSPPIVSRPAAPSAKKPATATTENPLRPSQPKHPPHAPRAPSGSLCAGGGSCGSFFLPMLPLLKAIVCTCAPAFERLIEAPALWRPTRFVSLRERPG